MGSGGGVALQLGELEDRDLCLSEDRGHGIAVPKTAQETEQSGQGGQGECTLVGELAVSLPPVWLHTGSQLCMKKSIHYNDY